MSNDILLEIFKFLSYEEARKIREVSSTWKFVVKKFEFLLFLKVIREEMALSPNGIHFCYENFEKSNIRFSYRQFKNCCFSKLFVYVYGRNWKLTLRTLTRLARLNKKINVNDLEFSIYTQRIFQVRPHIFSELFNFSDIKLYINDTKIMNFIINNPCIMQIPCANSIVVDVPRRIFDYWGAAVDQKQFLDFIFDENGYPNREEFYICVKNLHIIGKIFKKFGQISNPVNAFKTFHITLHDSIITEDSMNRISRDIIRNGGHYKDTHWLHEENVYGENLWCVYEKLRRDEWKLKAYVNCNYKIYFSYWMFKQLEKINSYRKQHGSKPLVLDKTLNAYAQEWSENLAKTGRLAHRPSNKYGENIAMASDPLHHDAAKMWYDEYPQYKFNQPDNNYGALHFSQVVWKACTKLGIGLAKCNDGTYIVVANFDPKGNILGQFKENVQDK